METKMKEWQGKEEKKMRGPGKGIDEQKREEINNGTVRNTEKKGETEGKIMEKERKRGED